MKRFVTTIAFLTTISYLVPSTAHAQAVAEAPAESSTAESSTADLPPAAQVLADYIDAVGGRDKLASVQSRSVKGKMKIPLHQAEAPLQVSQQVPGALAAKVEFPGLGDSLQGTRGDLAWDVNPILGGARLLKGKEKQQLLRMADLHIDLNFDKYYKSMQTVERIDVDEKPHFKVELVTINDDKETRYYDCSTHLLSKVEQTASTPMGEVDVTEERSDYRNVDGILLPFVLKQNVMGTDMIIEYDSVEINTEIDPAVFEIPEAVQELIDKESPGKEKEDKE